MSKDKPRPELDINLRATPTMSNKADLRVDRKNRMLNGVSVIEIGPAIGHDFSIDDTTLNQVIERGNARTQGTKARFTHPDASTGDSLGQELGRMTNFRKSDDNTRVLADVKILKAAEKSPEGDIAGWVLDIAEEDPGQVGFSTHSLGPLEHDVDEDGEPITDETGKRLPPKLRVKTLKAVDLVDSPAANRQGIFASSETAYGYHQFAAMGAQLLEASFDYNVITEINENDLRNLAGEPIMRQALGVGLELDGNTFKLSDGDHMAKAAAFLNVHFNRKGVRHPDIDAAMLTRILTKGSNDMTKLKDGDTGEVDAPELPQSTKKPAEQKPADPPVVQLDPTQLTAAVNEGIKAESLRTSEIQALSELFPDTDLKEVIKTCVEDTTCSIDSAKAKVLEAITKDQTVPLVSGSLTMGDTASEKFCSQVTDAILLRGGIIKDTDDGADAIRSTGLAALGPIAIAKECLRLSGYRGNTNLLSDEALWRQLNMGASRTLYPMDQYDAADETTHHLASGIGHSTGDFPMILANAGNKALIKGYNESAVTWPQWVKIGDLKDFKVANRIRLSESPLLDERQPGRPAEHGTYNEQQEPIGLKNYAKAFSYLRQMFLNDDLRAFLDTGRRMGAGATLTIERLLYVSLLSNSGAGPTMGDATSLFTSGHANLAGSGAAPTQTTLSAGMVAMMSQTGTGQDGSEIVVGAAPRFSLSGIARAVLIEAILKSPFTGSDARRDPQNSVLSKITPIYVPQLELQAENAWYLVADQNSAPSYEIAFLNGNRTPRTKAISGGTIDGTTIVVDTDFDIHPTGGWQGMWRNPGA